jgi:optic atrophy 3 protein
VSFAQNLHRIDTRLRLGLLQDPQILSRQIAKEVAEAEARRKKTVIPGVKNGAQTKLDNERIKKEIKQIEEKAKTLPRVKPLTEAKAIETGANFISETFLFCVAGTAIVFEYWRSKRKESSRRDVVSDRLDQIEQKLDRLEVNLANNSPASSAQTPKSTVVDPSSTDRPTDKASDAGRVQHPARNASKPPAMA